MSKRLVFSIVIIGLLIALSSSYHTTYAQRQTYELVVILGPETGRSVGVFSVPVSAWGGMDHSTEDIAFGNYVGPDSGSIYARSYLEFPLSNLPEGVVVEQVTLSVYVDSLDIYSHPDGGVGEIGAYVVAESWAEDMTWDQRVSFGESLAHTTVTTHHRWYEWILSGESVFLDANDDTLEIMLAAYPNPEADPAGEGVDNLVAVACGRFEDDPSLRPKLTILFSYPPTATPPPTAVPSVSAPTSTPVPPPTLAPSQPTQTSITLLPATGPSSLSPLWLILGGILILTGFTLKYLARR